MGEFVEYLKEAFSEFGPVTARRMFGGHGVFHQGVMIGLVADEQLYLKVDDSTAPKFAAEGSQPFQYNKGNKVVSMSYYLAPEEALENPLVMKKWARLAFDAALRSRK